MFQKLIRIAHQHPETRVYLVPLIRRILTAETKSTWRQFLDAKYDGGRRPVPNPNPETLKQFPRVQLVSAMRYETGGRKPVWEKVVVEYRAWLKDEKGYKEKKVPSRKPEIETKPKVEPKFGFPKGTPDKKWKFKENDWQPDISTGLKKLSGALRTPVTKADLARIVGLPFVKTKETPEIFFRSGGYGDKIRVAASLNSPIINMDRLIGLDEENNPYIYNDTFRLEKKAPKGTGARIFANQVSEAATSGFKYIKCVAQQDLEEGWHGAVVWPKLGYDGEIPFERPRGDKGLGPPAPPLPKELEDQMIKRGAKKPYKFSDLMPIKGGPEWWEKNAVTFHGKFDLAKDSYSMRYLKAYIEKKSKLFEITTEDWMNSRTGDPEEFQGTKKVASKQVSRNKHEEIDLEPEDDQIAKEIWKSMRKPQ